MAAIPRDDSHNDSTPGTKLATALALALVLCFALIYSIAKSKGSYGSVLGVIRETGPRSRAAGLRGAELDSIPIFKFKAGRGISSKKRPLWPMTVEQDAPVPAGEPTTTASTKNIIQSHIARRLPESMTKLCLMSKRSFGPYLQVCSICTEDFVDGDDIRRLPCDHIFHQRCIDPWLTGFAVTCPLWQVSPHPQSIIWFRCLSTNNQCLLLDSRVEVTVQAAALHISKPQAVIARVRRYD